ncbi:MAG: formylglycine-generating enzyme family protein [Desulfatibacillum sp.]|nr:formylglycine-generating enzyme family protein [Desulfatibacillum sp.]
MTRTVKLLSIFSFFAAICMVLAPAAALAGQDEFTNMLGMEFVKIEAGSFQMGAPEGDMYEDAQPAHNVTVSNPFFLGKFEITRKQWAKVMGQNPEKVSNPDNPVEEVTYEDVQLFLLKLNKLEGTEAYRLPTEAEWEYAARAGSASACFFGDDLAKLGEYAWYYANAAYTQPVGQLKPNAWGLYDMYGNVFEWCQDFYGQEYYKDSPALDPKGIEADPKARKAPPRVVRGGGWYSKAQFCTSAARNNSLSSQKFIGFRLVKDIE